MGDICSACHGRLSLYVPLGGFRSVAIAAVASCEEGWKYALKLLTLMNEEGVAPDRFTLTAIGESSYARRET